MIIPVILAGGSGTRLWPLSRSLYPKQLMNLVDERSMFQNTIQRLTDAKDIGAPVIICNENHRFMIAEQLRELGIEQASIILEPVGRNTAPAVAVAALKTLETDEDSVILVLPADHFIENIPLFVDAVMAGYSFASMGSLITFGIVPTAPETGYGYIRSGKKLPSPENALPCAREIAEFVEKPDRITAEKYLASGEYFWNSGIFMFKSSQVLDELRKHSPDIVDASEKALRLGRKDLDFFRLDKASFETCPSDSIDYAIMEKTSKGAMVALNAGWNDLGSWEALWQVGTKDENDNVTIGDVFTHDVNDSYLRSSGRMIAAVGLKDHIVVETADAILISPRNRVQDIKRLVNQLKAEQRSETISHTKEYRPWGSVENIDSSDRFQVKKVIVKPKEKLSLQKHFHRAEHWIVVRGIAKVIKDDKEFLLKEDQSTYIPLGVTHRLENPGIIPLEIIEVRSGSFLGKEDIVRIEDDYGR